MNLYKFEKEFYYGTLSGLFISTPEQLRELIGKEIYFGEVLGKHSEVYGEIKQSDFTDIPVDDETIRDIFLSTGNTVVGYNPLNYLREGNEDGV